MTPRQAEILDALQNNLGLSMRKIAKLTGTSQSMVSKVKCTFMAEQAGYERTRCLGPGPTHYFMSPDKRRIRFCRNHKYLTHQEAPETYAVVTRG